MNLDSLIAEKIFNTKEQQKHNHTHIKEIKKQQTRECNEILPSSH